MNQTLFDKLAYVESLKAGGFDENQARVQAIALETAMHEAVATKADTQDVKDLIAELRSEMQVLIAEVRLEMRAMENRLTLRMGGMTVVATGVIIAAMKILS